ncbi:hypothetical protein ACTHAM_001031 [Cellulomonas soli]
MGVSMVALGRLLASGSDLIRLGLALMAVAGAVPFLVYRPSAAPGDPGAAPQRAHQVSRPRFQRPIVGRLRYCHPPGGMLRIADRRLSWLNAPGGIEYPVPLGGLRFVRSRADGPWAVAECIDGDVVVEIRCRAYARRHVRAVLEH